MEHRVIQDPSELQSIAFSLDTYSMVVVFVPMMKTLTFQVKTKNDIEIVSSVELSNVSNF